MLQMLPDHDAHHESFGASRRWRMITGNKAIQGNKEIREPTSWRPMSISEEAVQRKMTDSTSIDALKDHGVYYKHSIITKI